MAPSATPSALRASVAWSCCWARASSASNAAWRSWAPPCIVSREGRSGKRATTRSSGLFFARRSTRRCTTSWRWPSRITSPSASNVSPCCSS
eukprot:12662062-Alexandrium_andersonii.AAC.1